MFFNPGVKKKLISQRKYYNDLLANLRIPDAAILDIGANEGFVSEIFLDKGFGVVAVEPDPRNVSILKARFGLNRNFLLYPCLCGTEAGLQQFWLSERNNAFSTNNLKWKNLLSGGNYRFHAHFMEDPIEIQATTLDEILRAHGKLVFAKIDAEGSELNCFQGLSEKIPLIAFEANLPEFAEETISCVQRLAAIDEGATFNYSSEFNLPGPEYLTAIEFCNLISTIRSPNIDVICRMSNYLEFYGA